MKKLKILVSRANFPEIIDKLERHFEVESNQPDVLWSKAELIAKLQGKVGLFSTSGEPMDAEVIAACPQLKICASMAVQIQSRSGTFCSRDMSRLLRNQASYAR